jgi:hypothetical protein
MIGVSKLMEGTVIRAAAIMLALLTSPVLAQISQPYYQPYDFNDQRRDIQILQDDLAKRQRETPFWDSTAQERLREQEYSLRNMEERNREAETDWILRGR